MHSTVLARRSEPRTISGRTSVARRRAKRDSRLRRDSDRQGHQWSAPTVRAVRPLHAPYKARADAAVTLIALNGAYFARFGTDICLSSGYRTFEQQLALRAAKGAIAAGAGQSNHGWGLAVDLCPAAYAGTRGVWLHDVGRAYGWANPAWAHRGGGGSYEPWHWEYVPGVDALTAGGGADS
ncbi:hypothetical protein DDP54_16075 (plasmid) [Cellulomonas sp. WB94]|nr:hypothetical protein DDP54_16075 [Cellulomonas sp. WB94]